MIDIFDKKLYKGGLESEEMASRLHDKIQVNIFGIFVSLLKAGNSKHAFYQSSGVGYSRKWLSKDSKYEYRRWWIDITRCWEQKHEGLKYRLKMSIST